MPLVTESELSRVLDLPVQLPATELRQGDWMVVSSVRVVKPMRLNLRFLSLSILGSSVDLNDVETLNRINSSHGLAFVGLYRDYTSGHPGSLQAIDQLTINGQGTTNRTAPPVSEVTEGVYSIVLASNMQANSSVNALIGVSTSINLNVTVCGAMRLELDSN